MAKIIIKDPEGREVWCYGSVQEDSNFSVVCDDEGNDTIVPGLDSEPTNWQEAINTLHRMGYMDMEQVETC